jgi:hypothetical protein
MRLLLQRFLDICLLRAAPQDIPGSAVLLLLALIAYCVAGLSLSLINADLSKALILVAVDLLILAGLMYLLLWIRLLTNRYLQTLTALAGTGAILEFVAWPVLYWQQLSSAANGPGLWFASLLLWLWLFWNIAVVAHILRHTLSTNFFNGALLSVLYMFVSVSVIRILFYSPAS